MATETESGVEEDEKRSKREIHFLVVFVVCLIQ